MQRSVFIHDLIKIKYVQEGYLTINYPPHLISDKEMMNAFLEVTDDFYDEVDQDNPTPDDMLNRMSGYYIQQYVKPMIKQFNSQDAETMTEDEKDVFYAMWNIAMTILNLYSNVDFNVKAGYQDNNIEEVFPDWVYSYMLGSVVGPSSDIRDIHDVLTLIDEDNLYDVWTVHAAAVCLVVSTKWLKKSLTERTPACFGEPHVVKALRVRDEI